MEAAAVADVTAADSTRYSVAGHVTVGAVARSFGVTPKTVRNWIVAKHLRAIRTPGGMYRIRRDDFEALKIKSEKWNK